MVKRTSWMVASAMLGVCVASVSLRGAETNTRSQTIKFGVPFKIGLQKSVALPGGKVAFNFARIAGDSRCPADRDCVWEGQVKTAFELRRGGRAIGSTTLTVLGRNRVIAGSSATVKPYYIRLLRVDPYPGDPGSATTPIQATVIVDNKPLAPAGSKPKPTSPPQPVRKG